MLAGRASIPPRGGPPPAAATFDTPEERAVWKRLRFVTYLAAPRRPGRGDRAAEHG